MKLTITLIILLVLYSCNTNQSPKEDWNGAELIKINPNGTNSISLDSLIVPFDYVKLETNSNSVLASIDKVIKVNTNYYILDRTFTCIKIFDKEGKYIGNVGNYGPKEGEYLDIMDFTYDSIKNIIKVITHAPGVLKYNLKGQYIGKANIPFAVSQIYNSDTLKYMYLNQFHAKSTKHSNLIITDTSNKIKRRFFPIPTKLNGSITYVGGLLGKYDYLYFNPPLTNKVYKLVGLKAKPAYMFNFTGNEMPIKISKSFSRFIAEGQKYSFLKNSFIKSKTFILFTFVTNGLNQIGCYNFKTRHLATTINRNKHSKTIIMADNFWDINDNTIISYLPSRFILKNISTASSYDSKIKSIIKRMIPGDNPILVSFHIKQF